MNASPISGRHITRAEQPGGITPAVHSVLAVFSSKEPRPLGQPRGRGINISGVDFWHAVEFSRNGRFLRNPFQDSSGRFPSVFPTLSGFFVFPDRRSANMRD